VNTASSITSSPPNLDDVLNQMLEVLRTYFPRDPEPSLETSVSVVSVVERSLGLGNRRGQERFGGFSVVALKGGRLEAVIRFQAGANSPEAVDTAIANLHADLLAAKDNLWADHFLRVTAQETSLAELITAPNTWRKTTDYQILYEYHYQDTDSAQSLIARIPIHSDPEVRNSPQRETTTVTDEMVRWDNESPSAVLVIRELSKVGRLNILYFIPATRPSGQVTLTRTFDGAIGPPQSYPNLAEFLANVGGPEAVDRHGQVTFDSFSQFLDVFEAVEAPPIALGDWDEDNTPDNYESGVLTFDPAIWLPASTDRLEIAYQNGPFDQMAVVYLQARSG
jgi:hypothetical protein